jgi:hypothetical protein
LCYYPGTGRIIVADQQEIENYRRFRTLTTTWVELAIELAKLRRDEGKSKKRDTEKE